MHQHLLLFEFLDFAEIGAPFEQPFQDVAHLIDPPNQGLHDQDHDLPPIQEPPILAPMRHSSKPHRQSSYLQDYNFQLALCSLFPPPILPYMLILVRCFIPFPLLCPTLNSPPN